MGISTHLETLSDTACRLASKQHDRVWTRVAGKVVAPAPPCSPLRFSTRSPWVPSQAARVPRILPIRRHPDSDLMRPHVRATSHATDLRSSSAYSVCQEQDGSHAFGRPPMPAPRTCDIRHAGTHRRARQGLLQDHAQAHGALGPMALPLAHPPRRRPAQRLNGILSFDVPIGLETGSERGLTGRSGRRTPRLPRAACAEEPLEVREEPL